jgi:hypothetical protein
MILLINTCVLLTGRQTNKGDGAAESCVVLTGRHLVNAPKPSGAKRERTTAGTGSSVLG